MFQIEKERGKIRIENYSDDPSSTIRDTFALKRIKRQEMNSSRNNHREIICRTCIGITDTLKKPTTRTGGTKGISII